VPTPVHAHCESSSRWRAKARSPGAGDGDGVFYSRIGGAPKIRGSAGGNPARRGETVAEASVEQVCESLKFLSGAFTDVADLLGCWQSVWDAAKRGPIPPALIEDAKAALDEVDVARLRVEIPAAMKRALGGLEQIGGRLRRTDEVAVGSAGAKQPVNLREVVENAATIARTQHLQTVAVEIHVAEDLPHLAAFRGELDRALLLLIDRAARAIGVTRRSGARGRITVTADRSGDQLRLLVEDDGLEIAPERCDALFDAPADGSENPLAEVAQIVRDRHGGRILYESGTGRGTRFLLMLPLAPAKARKPVAAKR
jgi:hypothetical protein